MILVPSSQPVRKYARMSAYARVQRTLPFCLSHTHINARTHAHERYKLTSCQAAGSGGGGAAIGSLQAGQEQ